MTIEEQWSNADGCANLRRLLDGKRPLYEHTLENCIGHWQNCTTCQDSYPNALQTINALQEGLENEIREEFGRLKHQFLSRKHGLLSSLSAGAQPYGEILVELFNAALEISFDLGFVNGFGGLADFSLFPSSDEDSEQHGAWRGSARFLRSLNDETQHFVFTALLSYDLLRSAHAVVQAETNESRSQQSVDFSGTQHDLNKNFIRFLSHSALQTNVLLDMLEKSSAWYRAEYFAKNPPEEIPSPLERLSQTIRAERF